MGVTSIDPHRRYRELIGAYALGHLDGARLETIEAHLEGCPACRAELEELSSVAAVLPLADPPRIATGASPAPPPLHLVEKVEDRVGRARRGRTYRLAAGGLAATAAAALAVLFLSPFSASLKDPTVEQVDFRRLFGQEDQPAFENVAATATLEEEGWGTRIDLDASGLLAGETYAVWLEGEDGERVPAGTFQAEDEEEIDLVLGAAMPAGDAVALGLGTSSGETFLQANLKLEEDAVGTLAVPDLRDKSPEEARELAGPDFEIETDGGDDEEPGATVAEQDPAPGERLPKDAEIYLEIETPDEKEVPDVENLDQEAAEEELEEDGFEVEVEYRESSPEEAGEVLEQDPAGDEEAERGSKVLIVIGTGPDDSGSAQEDPGDEADGPDAGADPAAEEGSPADGTGTGAGTAQTPSGSGAAQRAPALPDAGKSTPGSSGGTAPLSPPAPISGTPAPPVPIPNAPAPPATPAPVPETAPAAPGGPFPVPVPAEEAPEPEDVPAVPVPVPAAPVPAAPAPPAPVPEEAPEPQDDPPMQAAPPVAPVPTAPAPAPAPPAREEPPDGETPEPDGERETSDDESSG